LSFNAGDSVEVLGPAQMGWLKAFIGGKEGHVPGEFIQFMKSDQQDRIKLVKKQSVEGTL
jgi:hypothetical protein